MWFPLSGSWKGSQNAGDDGSAPGSASRSMAVTQICGLPAPAAVVAADHQQQRGADEDPHSPRPQRAMISFITSVVPPPIGRMRASRLIRSTRVSRM